MPPGFALLALGPRVCAQPEFFLPAVLVVTGRVFGGALSSSCVCQRWFVWQMAGFCPAQPAAEATLQTTLPRELLPYSPARA